MTLVNQSLTSFVYSGAIADFELYVAVPSSITIGGGREQNITVTVTAQVAPSSRFGLGFA